MASDSCWVSKTVTSSGSAFEGVLMLASRHAKCLTHHIVTPHTAQPGLRWKHLTEKVPCGRSEVVPELVPTVEARLLVYYRRTLVCELDPLQSRSFAGDRAWSCKTSGPQL